MVVYAGVEGGGTTWRVALAEGHPSNIVESQSFVTLDDAQEQLKEIKDWLSTRKYDCLGIGTFGPIDPREVRHPPYGLALILVARETFMRQTNALLFPPVSCDKNLKRPLAMVPIVHMYSAVLRVRAPPEPHFEYVYSSYHSYSYPSSNSLMSSCKFQFCLLHSSRSSQLEGSTSQLYSWLLRAMCSAFFL